MARRPQELKIWLELDERSAGFFALGLARTVGQPVALICTSGTAAANFMPAVVEAHYSRIPLLVLTADRPPELRDNGAPQAIDQLRMYGSYAKWFAELALPEASNEMLRYIRTMAGRAVSIARSVPAGPVQLNFPLREPLMPVAGPLPPLAERQAVAWNGRNRTQPYVQAIEGIHQLTPNQIETLAEELGSLERGVIVVGTQDERALAQPLMALAQKLGWPVLADPLSQLRQADTINNYDAFLRLPKFRDMLEPQLILRFGAAPTAKPFLQYIQHFANIRLLVVDGAPDWREPTAQAEQVIWADPVAFCNALSSALANTTKTKNSTEWLTKWQRISKHAHKVVQAKFSQNQALFEGQVFDELTKLLPTGSTLFVGNSMPVRDLDTFFNPSVSTSQILCNRGANGIDGVVSSALGAAAGLLAKGVDTTKVPLVLVIGDISFYHDLNGLLAAKLHQLDATIILLNNDGGGIFSFLAQADYPEYFEALFGTPHGLDFTHAAALYGADFKRVEDWQTFRASCSEAFTKSGLKIIEVPTNRQQNVLQHRQLWEAINSTVLE
jgi:2-succinyl-5-enolpyruvyl-6-hydroxy-3-cyclohexene-1-carboxylate synthase